MYSDVPQVSPQKYSVLTHIDFLRGGGQPTLKAISARTKNERGPEWQLVGSTVGQTGSCWPKMAPNTKWRLRPSC